MNNRILEALPLRQFFQEQMDHISELVIAYQNRALEEESRNSELSSAVEVIVDGTDKRLRAIGDYRSQLRDSARSLLDHIDELVKAMPAALTITRKSFIYDSLISALFKSYDTTQKFFCSDSEVQKYFSDPAYLNNEYMFGLVFLNCKEKNILGAEFMNDMLVRDVRQTHVSFDDLQLIAVCESEEDARRAMREKLFQRVIECLRYNISMLRHGLSKEEKLKAANNPELNINNPEVYIHILAEQLSLPRTLINIQDKLLKINSMGIKLPLDSDQSSDILKLYEIDIGDQARVATIVRYPRNEFHPMDKRLLNS